MTTARDDRHLVRMAVTDLTASSTVLNRRRWSTETGLDLSSSTVRRRRLRAGLVARMPLRRLPFSRDYQRLRLQWAHELSTFQSLRERFTTVPQEADVE